MVVRLQAIQKEHGLDNYEKVKRESVLEMVRRSSFVPAGGMRVVVHPICVVSEGVACSQEAGGEVVGRT